jgi:hypothetical protein
MHFAGECIGPSAPRTLRMTFRSEDIHDLPASV